MSDTTVTRNVTRGQIKQYLSQIGENPESDAFAELFNSMEDEVEEDEWDDLVTQFSDAGTQVDMEKASQMIPGMTNPGPTIPAETLIGPTLHGESTNGDTLIGLASISAAEPFSEEFTSDPPPPGDDPILVPVEEGPPEPPGATKQFESVVPFESPSVATSGDEDAQRVTVPVPSKAKVEEKKKSSILIPLLGVATFAAILGLFAWPRFGGDESSPPIVVQTVPSSTPPPAPKPTDVKTPTPTVSSQIIATCNITRYGLRDCTFQGRCTRSNTQSLYLQATCGNTQYRAQESERNLPLGEGRKVTLIKNGT